MIDDRDELLTRLSTSLGQLRADFSTDSEILSMFSQPRYWSELVASRPCFLVGGRGTGKTTALRALGFRRQHADPTSIEQALALVGSYWRIESNVTSAFAGARLDDEQWTRLFSHYVNLRLCELVAEYLRWRETETGEAALDKSLLQTVKASLHLSAFEDVQQLQSELAMAIARLEANLNGSPARLATMDLSVLGRPIQYLLAATTEEALPPGAYIAFCIDEYENLLPYQQRIINTLIKHVGDARYTFKVGVRSTTAGERATLAIDQPLNDPADYTTIDIVEHLKEQSFKEFASAVCSKRLEAGVGWSGNVADLLPGLSLEEEAVRLGVEQRNSEIHEALVTEGASGEESSYFHELSPLGQYLVGFWSASQGLPLRAVLAEAIGEPDKWSTRLGNYGYAALFTIRAGRRGVRKYFTGWSVICQLAEGNIRILLRLVHEALRLHVTDVGKLSPVSPELQTDAGVRIGETILRELQAQSRRGGELRRLTLSVGRIFGAMAASPEGHAPEVNQFRVTFKNASEANDRANSLLLDGTASGAFASFAGNKEGSATGGTKQPDYRLNPVFAPYFVFSHRRKRRISFTVNQVLAMSTDSPGHTISAILRGSGSGRNQRVKAELPDQLLFYEEFFDEA